MLKDWDCETCTDEQKVHRGCEGGATLPVNLGGEAQDTCPRRLLLDEPRDFGLALQLYSLYDKGMLMFEGGVAVQPVAYMRLMQVISHAVGEVEEELSERAKRK